MFRDVKKDIVFPDDFMLRQHENMDGVQYLYEYEKVEGYDTNYLSYVNAFVGLPNSVKEKLRVYEELFPEINGALIQKFGTFKIHEFYDPLLDKIIKFNENDSFEFISASINNYIQTERAQYEKEMDQITEELTEILNPRKNENEGK